MAQLEAKKPVTQKIVELEGNEENNDTVRQKVVEREGNKNTVVQKIAQRERGLKK